MSDATEITACPIMQQGTLNTLKSDLGTDTYQHLLSLFEQELTQLHAKLFIAVEQQQFQDINNATHILKNTAALYGAERLSASASLVYQLKSNQSYIAQTQQLIDIINDTLTEYKAHINSIAE
ncbi:Hpt domain-containing protein [Shewanella ulleungensis]|jgi:HPt (histidine-containing phosphotransfer) domain-containing protein|uniref:HPt domain-containing protein n=1 Tax=Shewanella ulleungensis TaxID=2282699 RepID=A0ABQ2QCP8_9GAMM|nr:Hpt domain-containing protein [Shewanella ulleungensis]MCL1148735.1 Hpt domain-containing protein [Shewanella ulleungensis]GGP75932.1 hypothetical protein GCM10009410_05280 [Shewanella ulleungensis]